MSGSDGGIWFELLGPVRVIAAGRELPVRAGRERAVLAMLLLHAGRTVPVEQLVEAVWSGAPPPSARNQIQTSVSQLRRRLAGAGRGDLIVTEPSGYRACPERLDVDVHRFRALVAQARTAAAEGRYGEARDTYRSAVALWQGFPLTGVDSDLVRGLAGTLEVEREQALEECLEAELAVGGAGELVAELTGLVQRHPFRERLHGALMRALYRAGRPADALAAFRRAHRLFHDQLGTEPGEELQQLHAAILNRDPELLVVTPPPVGSGPGLRELPVEASCFVGREVERARLGETLLPADQPGRRRPAIVVLYGPGGMGKSALAVRVAHELADQFPDGQLYVDLCGSTPGMRPLPASEVLGRFLRRLGVHPSEVPSGEAEAAARFRSVTAERRLLLLLDNAATKEQVAPLLPGTPGCAVLVTSRQPLPTLDADDRVRVTALSDQDGLTLLTGLLDRVGSEPGAATEIVALCGGLPLAIRVAAGRLACRPDLPATEYARRLADRSRRLDELQLDDLAVRASIRTSYDALLAGGGREGLLAARAFRSLGLLRVPDVAPPVVAAMLAEPDVELVRAALDRLVDAQLVEPAGTGRYRLHDLVRLVAAERADQEDSRLDRGQAVHRAIAFYTHAAVRAETRMRPSRVWPFGAPPPADCLHVPMFAGPSEVKAWTERELASMRAALAQAVTSGGATARLCLWLSDALWASLDIRCDWQAAIRVAELTTDAATRHDDPELAAHGLLLYGRSLGCLGAYANAVELLQQSLRITRVLGSQIGAALAFNALGVVWERSREPAAALAHYAEAFRLSAEGGQATLAASVQNNMIVSYAVLGQLDAAIAVGRKSSAASSSVDDVVTYATAELNLSAVYSICGDQAFALQCADRALAVSQQTGDRVRTCEVLLIRSVANARSGRLSQARKDLERARSLAEMSGYRYALAVAERQLSIVLAREGRACEAARANIRACEETGRLDSAFRDPMIDLLFASAAEAGQSAPDRSTPAT